MKWSSMIHRLLVILLLAVAVSIHPVRADSVVYSHDFEGVLPPEITSSGGVGEPVGDLDAVGFSGSMLRLPTGSTLTLSLTGLPTHVSLSLDFLLGVLDSMDGSMSGGDALTISLDGQEFFSGTFGNAVGVPQGYTAMPGVTLARRQNLGFEAPLDSAYQMGRDLALQRIPHSGPTATITLQFTGSGSGIADESWALDQLRVTAHDLPEVGQLALAIAENGDRVIAFNGAPGVVSLIQKSTTLGPASWPPLEFVPGVWHGHARVRDSAPGPRGFYKASIFTPGLATISVVPHFSSIPRGTTLQFTATLLLPDGTLVDVTDESNWSSSQPAVVAVANGPGVSGYAVGLASAGSADISAEFMGSTGSATVFAVSPSLNSIEVAPSPANVWVGDSVEFTATGTFSDGSTEDVTHLVTWASSDPTRATISNDPGTQGVATGLLGGVTTITASLGAVDAGSILTVDVPVLLSAAITPDPLDVPIGLPRSFTLTGTFSDGSIVPLSESATWSIANPALASVSNDPGFRGRVAGFVLGTTTVTASYEGTDYTATVHITPPEPIALYIDAPTSAVAKGLTLSYSASITYSDGSIIDGTNLVTWTSGSPVVATISNAPGTQGQASGIEEGTSLISASFGSLSASSLLTVTAPVLLNITISPANPVVDSGEKIDLTATAHYSDGSSVDITTSATWSSNNTGVATVGASGANAGTVNGISPGTAKISVSFGSNGESVTVTVN